MNFNPEKCYVIHVTKKKIPFKLNYKLHNHILQPVDNSKYVVYNNLNKVGPKTVPCGTPESTDNLEDVMPFKRTCCCLFSRDAHSVVIKL
jgi:hypothetical protein